MYNEYEIKKENLEAMIVQLKQVIQKYRDMVEEKEKRVQSLMQKNSHLKAKHQLFSYIYFNHIVYGGFP